MKQLKNKNDKKKFLIDLYNVLEPYLRFNEEIEAITKIIEKMFNLDQQLAINWTSELINIYGKKGVSNIQNGYCEDIDIDSLIKSLLNILIKKIKIEKVISFVNNYINDYLIRSYIWRILFTEKQNLVIELIEENIIISNYDEAYDLIYKIIGNQKNIDISIFDPSLFIFKIIKSFTNSSNVNEKTLSFLYSLKKFINNTSDAAIFDSAFLDYII